VTTKIERDKFEKNNLNNPRAPDDKRHALLTVTPFIKSWLGFIVKALKIK